MIRVSVLLLLTVALSTYAALVLAAEIVVKPQLSTRGAYDDNPRLRLNSPADVFISISDAEVETRYSEPTYAVSFTPRIIFSRYTTETELSSEDYFIKLEGYKLFERHQFSGEFNFENEGTITTEELDSNIFNVNLRRTSFALNASWIYAINDRARLTTFGNALDVTFEENPASNFVDSGQFGLGSSLSYSVSSRTMFVGTFSASEFKIPSRSSETRSYSFQLGFEHQYDESMNVSFRFGHNVSNIEFRNSQTRLISFAPPLFETTFFRSSERSAGEIIDLTARKDFERSFIKLDWHRSFSPSSQGARQESQTAIGSARYRINQFIDADIRVSYRERTAESQIDTSRLGNIEVIRVGGRMLYRISKLLRAEVGYQFREVNRINSGRKSDSHRVFVGLRYTPTEIHFTN